MVWLATAENFHMGILIGYSVIYWIQLMIRQKHQTRTALRLIIEYYLNTE